MSIKSLVRQWIPPILLDRFGPLLGTRIRFSGNYSSWEAAKERASGYDDALILERVREAAQKVLDGRAKYERDSAVFDEVQHAFPVLAGLLRAASESGGRLHVLDYGGSLGSSYFQCRHFLPEMPSLAWGIVEQAHFVECGKSMFQTERLRFFNSIAECVRDTGPNVALLSSVLQYVPEPYRILEEIMSAGIQYLIVDRTPFRDGASELITVQHVPKSIYRASYPCRVFGRQSFADRLAGRYRMLAQFDSADGSGIAGGVKFTFGGMILRKS